MHITTKVNRAYEKINAFLIRTDYPESKKISYECTKTSLRYHMGVLQGLMAKGSRKENYNGSHYYSCTSTVQNNCECYRDNLLILDQINSINRLLRKM